MSWERGRSTVERLLADGELQQVTPSSNVADRLLADAAAHIGLASKGITEDPAGALQLSYDAVRKAAAALLIVQGLRATVHGGHVAVIDAARAQFNGRSGMEVFSRLHALRRRRNRTEYPNADSPGVNPGDAQQALETAEGVLDAARRLLTSGRLGVFE
ncbi:HEPN domain-containing protein [Candidatus Poriferisodalis sp.]|uniref:HEPN domain-containing protein n=1 Tax=Candidatus Poriferisodalis sp. TaxID=3101277 RepID=UPI003B5BE0F5